MKDQVKRNLFNFCANYIVSTPEPLQRAPPEAILHNPSLEYTVFLTLLLCKGQATPELDQPQIRFRVRQKQPAKLDKAVTSTLEMESYLFGASNSPLQQ